MRKFSSLLSTVFVVSSISVVTSCKDDDNQKSRTDLLTGTSWMVDKAQVEVSGQLIDVPTDFSPCGLDDVYTFTKAGVFSSTVGLDDCGDGSDKALNGTWVWKENETILSVTADDGDPDTDNTDDLTVVVLTETQLKIETGTIPYDVNGDGKDDMEVKSYLIYKSK